MFIAPAYAQTASGGGGLDVMQFLPFIAIAAVFYFLTIRPQQQKAKQHKARLAAIRRGDRVMTGGGIIGTVAKLVSDDEIDVKIAENTVVRVARSTIADVLSKSEPVGAKTDADAEEPAAKPPAGRAKADAAKDKSA